MTSKNVATLLTDLNITRSHSRPTFNDNPFSDRVQDSLVLPGLPWHLRHPGRPCAFSDLFFTYYNNEHCHYGIGLYTQLLYASAWAIQARR